MIPRRITGANVKFTPPGDWNEARDGKCANLMARVEGNSVATAWEPTPAELAMLNAGGAIVLKVYGGQPPICLTVEPLE
jgi:hypothetical protein